MYSVSAASLARQESAFLWPWPALSPLPALFPPPPPPLCVYSSKRREEEGGERKEEGRKKGKQGGRCVQSNLTLLLDLDMNLTGRSNLSVKKVTIFWH